VLAPQKIRRPFTGLARLAISILITLVVLGQPLRIRAQPSAPYIIHLPFVRSGACNTQLTFTIDPGVPSDDENLIKRGLCNVQLNLQTNYGGDISPQIKSQVGVRIAAIGSGPVCCQWIVNDTNGGEIYLDVLHPHWAGNRNPPGPWTGVVNLEEIAAHEYTHAWQSSLGCLTVHAQPLGRWMNEGIAQFIGHDTYIWRGDMMVAAVRAAMLDLAISDESANYPLETFEGTDPAPWAGYIGYIAIEKLVMDSPQGPMSLRNLCQQVGTGSSVDEAFQNSFGISKSDFYAAFPAYFDSLTP
jgi:hypothetical protein